MKITSWAVKRPVSILMLICAILILGGVSLSRLPIDLLPQLNIPIAVVSTQYPGVGPLEIENLITRPVEEIAATVHNVKRITSTSAEGRSMVVIEFNQGTDMEFATLEVREKVDFVKNYLPQEAMAPVVLKVDPNAFPIMTLCLSNDGDLEKLKEVAEYRIKPRLERLEGVASVSVDGGHNSIIELRTDPIRLGSVGLTMQQLATLLKAENINLPAGDIVDGPKNMHVRTQGEFNNIEEIKNLPILLPTGVTVALQDLAEVNLTQDEIQQITMMNKEPSIRITVQKQPIANTVQVANRVNNEIIKIQNQLEDIDIETIIDQSIFIKGAIENVGKTAIYGGLLAVLVLYIFLRHVKTTIIIALAIPISIIATFTLMYFFGITLNLLSLGGFALGIGMLVDNGIVVLENIYRYREEGHSALKSSINGAKEVAMAVTASTFTTIAVFLPIVFVEGITAQIFRELAMTVTFSLLASLGISLTLVPMLASKLLKAKPVEVKPESNEIFQIADRLFSFILKNYIKLLKWSLNHRKIVLIFTLATFILCNFLGMVIGAEYFPEFDEGTFTVEVRLPYDVTLTQTESVVNKIENILLKHKEMDKIFTNIGGGDRYFDSFGKSFYRATIEGKLVSHSKRKKTTAEVVDEIRHSLGEIAGAEISISNSSSLIGMGLGGQAVEIEIAGEDLGVLKKISEDFMKIVQSIEGTREVKSNYVEGRSQIEMKLKRDIASRYGLQSGQVASILRGYLSGITATRLRVDGRELDVIIKGEEYLRSSVDNFMQMPIPTALGFFVPLEQMGTLTVSQIPNTIRRTDQVRTITITADILNRDLNRVVRDIKKELVRYSLPAGYTYKFRGQREQLEESFSSLILAAILAILLVYMILASQFQSYLHPFTIMFSVPLAFSGGILGLFITGRPMNVPAFIGAIILSGIVVNNGIVLIDYINILRERGEVRGKAILKAGTTRLRPILMTTFTTILGLLPLAIGNGEGAEVQAPLATVVIGGLLLATLLTLIVIPVVYSLFDDVKARFSKGK